MVTFGTIFTDGVATPLAAVYVFYNGPSLPTTVYGEFLSIPATQRVLGPLSYLEVTTSIGGMGDHGSGQHFGASALSNTENLYLDALTHWRNFSDSFSSSMTLSVLAFTPVLEPQIQAGRARGGNAMSPPDGGYAAVQFAQTFVPGVTSMPADFEQGFQLLLTQYVVGLSVLLPDL